VVAAAVAPAAETRRRPPAPRPDEMRVRKLVQREQYIRNTAHALVARPPADIVYRLSAWYQVPDITVGEVVEILRDLRHLRVVNLDDNDPPVWGLDFGLQQGAFVD